MGKEPPRGEAYADPRVPFLDPDPSRLPIDKPAKRLTLARFLGLRNGSTRGSIYNLFSSVLGAGVLGLPHAVAAWGLVPGLVMVVPFALISLYTLCLLGWSGELTGAKSYRQLAELTLGDRFPVVSRLVSVAIFFNTFGSLVVYLIVLGDLIPSFARAALDAAGVDPSAPPAVLSPLLSPSLVIVAMGGLFGLPLSLVRDLSMLRYTSFLSMGSILFLAALLGVRFLQAVGAGEPATATAAAALASRPRGSVAQLLGGLPTFIYAFSCHFNFFSAVRAPRARTRGARALRTPAGVARARALRSSSLAPPRRTVALLSGHPDLSGHPRLRSRARARVSLRRHAGVAQVEALKRRSRKAVFQVQLYAISLSLATYVAIVSAVLLTYNDRTASDFLINLPTADGAFTVAKVLYTSVLIAAYPLNCHPCRSAFLEQVGACGRSDAARTAATVTLVALSITLAIVCPNIAVALSLVGGTATSSILYIFPALFFLAATVDQPTAATAQLEAAAARELADARADAAADAAEEDDDDEDDAYVPAQLMQPSPAVRVMRQGSAIKHVGGRCAGLVRLPHHRLACRGLVALGGFAWFCSALALVAPAAPDS